MYKACLLHSRAERVLKHLVSKRLEKRGINRMGWLLLASISEPSKHDEGHTMGELAEVLDIRLSQLTALASKMNREGLLLQIISPKDKRTKYVRATPKGTKLLDDIEIVMREAMKDWLAQVEKDDLLSYMNTVENLSKVSRIKDS